MLNFLDKWYDKIKPFLFKYKEGFFELPYLSNSPIIMIESFRKMPFIKHFDEKKYIESSSPFVDAIVYYQELSDELIIVHSKLIIKANICFRSTQKKDIANDFYCLTLSTNLEQINSSKRIIKGEQIERSSFQFLKAGEGLTTYHFKGSNFKSFSTYFKESWLQNYIQQHPEKNEHIIEFINSSSVYTITTIEDEDFVSKFIASIELEFQKKHIDRDLDFINNKVLEFINYYKCNGFAHPAIGEYYNISNHDRQKLVEVAKLLQEHIHSKFPGISLLANHVGFSETKLKSMFKLVYHKTLFEHFQEMQMKSAFEILLKKDKKISEVASYFGYSNAGKFSATFKNYMHILPSEIGMKTEKEEI